MNISVIQRGQTFQCPECGEGMTDDIVHILDSEEEPCLWSRCLKQGINSLVCRKGHYVVTLAIPVLAHDRAKRRLIFCPSDGTDDFSRDADIAHSMVARVHKYLPSSAYRDYLNEAEVIPLKFLSHALISPPGSTSKLLHLVEQPFGLSKCIETCREVLRRITRQDSPRVWADFQRWLAEGLLCSTEGESVRNIEEALRCITEAQTVYDEGKFPRDHAELEIIAGTCLSARLEDDEPLSEMLEQLTTADIHFKRAISLLSPERTPKAWAKVHVRRGALLLVMADCQDGARANEALKCFKEAGRVDFKGCDPVEKLVSEQSVIRLTELLRRTGDVDDCSSTQASSRLLPFATKPTTVTIHIEMLYTRAQELMTSRSIDVTGFFEQALQMLTAAKSRLSSHTPPKLAADAMALLGDVYAERYEGAQIENMEASINALKFASQVYETMDSVSDRVRALSSLGSSYKKLAHALPLDSDQADSKETMRRQDAGEAAVAALEQAAELINEMRRPNGAYAITVCNNLGNALQAQFDGVDCMPLKRAVAAYENGIGWILKVRSGILENHFGDDHLDEVEADTRSNMGAVYQELSRFDPDAARSAEAHLLYAFEYYKRQHLYDEVRRIALKLHRLYLDQDRAQNAVRVLEDAIGRAEALVQGAENREIQQLQSSWSVELYKAACYLYLSSNQLQPLRALELSDNMRAQLLRFDKQAKGQKQGAAGELRPLFLRWEVMQDWIKTRQKRVGVIEFLVMNNEVIAFVVKNNLDEPRIFHIPMGLPQLAEAVNLCLREVHNYTPGFPSRGLWSDTASILFEPFLDELEDVDVLLLVPNELLYYLPLHAVAVRGKPLSFLMPVAYAPSILASVNASISPNSVPTQFSADQVAVISSLEHLRRDSTTPYYTVEKLEGAYQEVNAVADLFGVNVRNGTKSEVLSALSRYCYMHIACHGHLDPKNPLQSGLVLADGVLTVRELLDAPIESHLVVLTACHSAFVLANPGDPFVGLAAALLYAGAGNVVAGQWAVSDEVTTALITRFYEEMIKHRPDAFAIASSLSTASSSLHDEHPEPYYWAPFCMYGGIN